MLACQAPYCQHLFVNLETILLLLKGEVYWDMKIVKDNSRATGQPVNPLPLLSQDLFTRGLAHLRHCANSYSQDLSAEHTSCVSVQVGPHVSQMASQKIMRGFEWPMGSVPF